MTNQAWSGTKYLLLVPVVLLLASCNAGNEQFTAESPAGFWYGLLHGAISVITLVIHIFNDSIGVYETNNTGGLYDFGFLLGVIFIWGGGCHIKCRSGEQKRRDKEWEEISNKVEIKIMRKLKEWAEDENADNAAGNTGKKQNREEWDEIYDKAERKLKRKIREWAEKD